MGDSVTILREGGVARLPSGQVAEHRLGNDITPAPHHSYLFFLSNRPSLEAFHYHKLWLIDGGKLKPLYPDDVLRAHEARSAWAGRPVSEAIRGLRAQTHK